MTIQTFTAGQKLTALQMNTLQASDFNFTRNVRTEQAYTFVLADKGKLVESTYAGAATFTIPPNATEAFTVGDRIDVLLANDGSVTIAGASGVTVYAEGDLTTISSKWTKVTLIKRATNSWVVTGGGLTVQTVELDDLSVTTAKLANDAVTSGKIADGAIVNADVNASAAIALSKLASGTSAQVVLANSSGVPTYTTLSGDVTVSNTGVTAIGSGKVTSDMIADGAIVNADVNSAAAIALSKLASGTSAQVVVANSSGIPTYTTLSGDVTVSNTGVTTIGSSKVTSAMIVDGTIVNGDVSSTAAISLSKLASGTSAQVVLANSSGVPTYTTLSGDVTVSDTGVTAIQPNSVALGTDTTGSYVESLVAGTGITLSNNSGEGATPTIAIGQAVSTSSSVTFAAVTAPLVGNASTASTLQTARTISLGGDLSGSVSFNGSSDVTISATVAANSVALGTDTTGNYMSDVSAGTGISVTHTPAEGSTATIALADSTIVSNAGSYSLTTSDKNKIVEITGASSASVTVPANSSQAFPIGSQVTIIRNGSGTVRIIGPSVTLRYTPGDYLRAQYSSATLIKRATDEWYLIGDLSS